VGQRLGRVVFRGVPEAMPQSGITALEAIPLPQAVNMSENSRMASMAGKELTYLQMAKSMLASSKMENTTVEALKHFQTVHSL
jgi:hypothetical protein